MRFPVFFLVAASLLSACTGGDTGVSTTPNKTPVPTSLPLPLQRYESESAILTTKGIEFASTFNNLINELDGSDIVREAAGAAKPVCMNGVEKTVTFDGATKVKLVLDRFYDSKCTQKSLSFIANITIAAGKSLDLVGNATIFSPQAAAIGYAAITDKTAVRTNGSTSVIQGTVTQTVGGPTLLAFGMTCTQALKAANNCGFGGVVNIAPLGLSLGVSATINGFVFQGKSKVGTVSLDAFVGPKGQLTFAPGAGDAWTIDGGTQVASQTGTFDETVNSSSMQVSADLAITDSRFNAQAATHLRPTTGMTGTAQPIGNPNVLTSFTIAPDGSGTIDYSGGNGSGTITFFVIRR
jgi:hypothetical protein